MAKVLSTFSKISVLRERYFRALAGKEALVKMIAEAEVAEQVYNSNAIENSTLTLEETEKILKRIAGLHLAFEYTHPFIDGNGRIGRAVNNYLLIREGFVAINIKFIDRNRYYDAFEQFQDKSKTGIMEEIVGKALTNSYHKRLAYLEGKKIITLRDYAKANKLSHSNLINKATRQTIEAFLEKGVWKIGV